MSGRRHDARDGGLAAYYRNTALAAGHLQMSGFGGARDNSWAGGFRGVDVPLESGHHVAVAAPLPGEWPHWSVRVTEHPEHPNYEQEGLPGSEFHEFDAKPQDVPSHVREYLRRPDTMTAMQGSMKRNLGRQWRPKS